MIILFQAVIKKEYTKMARSKFLQIDLYLLRFRNVCVWPNFTSLHKSRALILEESPSYGRWGRVVALHNFDLHCEMKLVTAALSERVSVWQGGDDPVLNTPLTVHLRAKCNTHTPSQSKYKNKYKV